MRVQPLTADAAETVAVQALGWMVRQDDLFGIFLGSSGAGVDDVRAGASNPDFLGFVLDFLLSREDDLLAFCTDADISPDLPARARAALPGGALPNWT